MQQQSKDKNVQGKSEIINLLSQIQQKYYQLRRPNKILLQKWVLTIQKDKNTQYHLNSTQQIITFQDHLQSLQEDQQFLYQICKQITSKHKLKFVKFIAKVLLNSEGLYQQHVDKLIHNFKDDFTKVQNNCSQLKQQLAQCQLLYSRLKDSYDDQINTNFDIQRNLIISEQQNDTLRKLNQQLQKQINQLKQKKSKLSQQIHSQRQIQQILRRSAKQKQEIWLQATKKQSQLSQQILKLHKTIQSLQCQVQTLQQQQQTFLQQIKNLSQTIENLNYQLQFYKNHENSSFIGHSYQKLNLKQDSQQIKTISKATNSDKFNSHNRSLQSFTKNNINKNTINKNYNVLLANDFGIHQNKENYLEIKHLNFQTILNHNNNRNTTEVKGKNNDSIQLYSSSNKASQFHIRNKSRSEHKSSVSRKLFQDHTDSQLDEVVTTYQRNQNKVITTYLINQNIGIPTYERNQNKRQYEYKQKQRIEQYYQKNKIKQVKAGYVSQKKDQSDCLSQSNSQSHSKKSSCSQINKSLIKKNIKIKRQVQKMYLSIEQYQQKLEESEQIITQLKNQITFNKKQLTKLNQQHIRERIQKQGLRNNSLRNQQLLTRLNVKIQSQQLIINHRHNQIHQLHNQIHQLHNQIRLLKQQLQQAKQSIILNNELCEVRVKKIKQLCKEYLIKHLQFKSNATDIGLQTQKQQQNQVDKCMQTSIQDKSLFNATTKMSKLTYLSIPCIVIKSPCITKHQIATPSSFNTQSVNQQIKTINEIQSSSIVKQQQLLIQQNQNNREIQIKPFNGGDLNHKQQRQLEVYGNQGKNLEQHNQAQSNYQNHSNQSSPHIILQLSSHTIIQKSPYSHKTIQQSPNRIIQQDKNRQIQYSTQLKSNEKHQSFYSFYQLNSQFHSICYNSNNSNKYSQQINTYIFGQNKLDQTIFLDFEDNSNKMKQQQIRKLKAEDPIFQNLHFMEQDQQDSQGQNLNAQEYLNVQQITNAQYDGKQQQNRQDHLAKQQQQYSQQIQSIDKHLRKISPIDISVLRKLFCQYLNPNNHDLTITPLQLSYDSPIPQRTYIIYLSSCIVQFFILSPRLLLHYPSRQILQPRTSKQLYCYRNQDNRLILGNCQITITNKDIMVNRRGKYNYFQGGIKDHIYDVVAIQEVKLKYQRRK